MKYNTHTTKDGQKILIEAMDDRHLQNTISMMLKTLEEFKQLSNLNVFEMKLRGITCDIGNVEQQINFIKNRLPSYVFEATLRNLDLGDFRKRYRDLTGRDSENNQLLLEIISGKNDEFDDDDY